MKEGHRREVCALNSTTQEHALYDEGGVLCGLLGIVAECHRFTRNYNITVLSQASNIQ